MSRIDRSSNLDLARGVLLVAMLAVHVISAHGSTAQVNALHGWIGIFLISGGFTGLSGYVIGMRAAAPTALALGRGIDRGLQLVLVMFAFGVLLSLLQYGLALIGTAGACAARDGWAPPLRFDDLGILLPIAIVQMLGPLAGARARVTVPALLALATCVMLVPVFAAGVDGVVLDVLVRRALTPFYTVTTYVAIGLVGVVLGRLHERWLAVPSSVLAALMCGVTACVLASPRIATGVLDGVYRIAGEVVGGIATLAYWTGVLILFVRAFVAWPRPHGRSGTTLATLGRNSLFVFVLHDLLLVLDGAARTWSGIEKGFGVVLVMWIANVAILVLAARGVERSPTARACVDALLLGRSRPGTLRGGGALSLVGGLALAGILAVYTSAGLARPDRDLVVDDFEAPTCPRWWTFGFLPSTRTAAPGGHFLELRGSAPGTFAHGRGVFLDRDLGPRSHLVLRVRGDGPGSGRIKIELSEDDNGNWVIEKQQPLYIPLHDDRFVHELAVDWRGWREVRIPLRLFRDDNAGGNGVLDPLRDLTSGGLLELQLLFAPTGSYGDEVRLALDDIRFTP